MMQKQKRVHTARLSKLEREILSFFIKSKRQCMKIEDILRNYHDGLIACTVLEAIIKLCRDGYLFLYNNTNVEIDNIPMILQVFIRFEYNSTAYLLYFLIKQNKFLIQENKTVSFKFRTFLISSVDEHTGKVITWYYKKNKILYNAINELKKKGYLIKRTGYSYQFNYHVIDKELLEFIVGSNNQEASNKNNF